MIKAKCYAFFCCISCFICFIAMPSNFRKIARRNCLLDAFHFILLRHKSVRSRIYLSLCLKQQYFLNFLKFLNLADSGFVQEYIFLQRKFLETLVKKKEWRISLFLKAYKTIFVYRFYAWKAFRLKIINGCFFVWKELVDYMLKRLWK